MNNEPQSTADLYFAATVMAMDDGPDIIGIKSSANKIYFKFADTHDLEKLHTEYLNRRLLVAGMKLRNNIVHLKSVITEAQKLADAEI